MDEVLHEVDLDDIFSDEEFNCRGHITPASVLSLSNDIEKNGLIQAIVIQPYAHGRYKWRIVAGHRRHLACKLWRGRGGPGTIKCRVMEGLDEMKALVINIKENLDREDLNMMQEARSVERFLRQGWSPKQVAEALGISKKWVEVRYGLLNLPESIQKRAEAGFLTQHQVEDILRMEGDQARFEYVRKCVDHKLHAPASRGGKKRGKKAVRRSSVVGGETRTQDEMFAEQERIQDCFDDVAHPMAVALGWAAGAISTEDFYKHCEVWAKAEGLTFKRPPKAA